MDLWIVTGGSRGLGAALIRQVRLRGHQVLSIARGKSASEAGLTSIQHDLHEFSHLPEKLESSLLGLGNVDNVHLVNNAAQILPMGALKDFSQVSIMEHINTNLMAPVLLTQWFLQKWAAHPGRKTVTNIISGAAYHPIPGWSLYCASKAGLRMFTENLQVDNSDSRLKFVNFSPGVMDTEMQATIRSQSEEIFSRVHDFQKMKAENRLRDPDRVAGLLLSFLNNFESIQKVDYDVQELEKNV